VDPRARGLVDRGLLRGAELEVEAAAALDDLLGLAQAGATELADQLDGVNLAMAEVDDAGAVAGHWARIPLARGTARGGEAVIAANTGYSHARMSRSLEPWPRRRLLRAASAGLGALALAPVAAVVPRRARAAPPEELPPELAEEFDRFGFDNFGPGSGPQLELDLPQLEYGGDWNPRPGAMRSLGQELRLRTRLAPVRDPSVVSLDPAELFLTPFLYVAGRGGLPGLRDNEDAERTLRRFVDLGGMIVFDDADGGADFGFERDVEGLVGRMLPGAKLTRVAADHVLYRSFYLIDFPSGRTRARDHVLGVQDEGRIKILYIPNDLGGALARGEDGYYRWSCSPGGSVQREWAIRLGVNVLLYATCTDYKSDRAHVETLMRSRRWR
jgi:hypothetical protein